MGAKQFILIERKAFQPNSCALEIGSDNEEGSTRYLASYCLTRKIPFYTVDVNLDAYERASWIRGADSFHMTGENFLIEVFPRTGHKIAFAYLDNFDWLWSFWDDAPWLVAKHIHRYQEMNLDLTNENSQTAHLEQTQLLEPYATDDCLIVYDDTWGRPDGTFDGKGGTAVPWLLEQGWVLYEEPFRSWGDPPSNLGWVAVHRSV